MHLIDADNLETWPNELLGVLRANAEAIRAYHKERQVIDRAAEVDVMLRIKRLANIHGPAWRHALEVANNATAGKFLRGYHATRLTHDEVVAIKSGGLEPLSVALLEQRLAALRDTGEIDLRIHDALRMHHQASENNRAGMVWFIFTKASLTDEGGVERFFRSWGGEALYNSHESHKTNGPALRAPGTPAIVQAAVPCDGIETFTGVGKRLVNAWCASERIQTGDGPEFEGYVRTGIPGADILRIDALGSGTFDALTRHQRWRKPL